MESKLEQILREAYKQGYLNARHDAEAGNLMSNDSDFDDWVSECIADNRVGNVELPTN